MLTSLVARYEQAGSADSWQAMQDTGLDAVQVDQAGRALRDEGYVALYFEGGGGFAVTHVTGDGRRAVGAWPTPQSLADRLVEAVERGLAEASSEEERSRWQKLRDGITGAGRDVMVGVATAALGGAVS
ncbi:MAG: hypothetical protein M3P31_04860 [Actinomycetota bacterium]|nr:hypothetical protein [Actinomycetota bacterium]